jgi:hypothetical protein
MKANRKPAGVRPTEVTVNSNPQYSATVEGVSYSKTENGTTVMRGLTTTYTHPGVDTSIGFYISNLNNPGVGFYLKLSRSGLVFTGSASANATFKAFFDVASYPFTIGGDNGIRVAWYDEAGQEWSTDAGIADQTGSAFNIAEIKEENTQDGYLVKVKATFNCKLYNGSGGSKTLTNGVYVGYFGNI